MQTVLDRQELKGLIKEALVEIMEERGDLLRNALEEALEDMGLVRAIQNGLKGERVSRDEVFAVLKGVA